MFKSFRRGVTALVVVALVLVPIGGTLLSVQFHPSVAAPRPPDATAAARTRDLAQTLRAIIEEGAATGDLTVTMEQLNAAMTSARRLRPGLVGRANIIDGTLAIEVSARVPLLPGDLWANFYLGIGASEHGLRITSARIGRLPLPPALVVPALRFAIDRYLGDGLGRELINGIDRVRIDGSQVSLAFAFAEADRVAMFERLKDGVRAMAGGTDARRIYTHLRYLDKEGDKRALPSQGSVLPYLRHVVERSAALSPRADREELKAALLALTLYCGEDAFGPAVGARLSAGMQGARNHCDGTTLAGRDDLKRHFIVSAGIYAARAGATAIGMGELKELLDSNDGGSGFSFDDMAADLAGARFARVFLEAPSSDWPFLLDLVEDETDILPPLDDLPSGMSEAEFRDHYGDLDSVAYADQIADINRRIDAMPLYSDRPGKGADQ